MRFLKSRSGFLKFLQTFAGFQDRVSFLSSHVALDYSIIQLNSNPAISFLLVIFNLLSQQEIIFQIKFIMNLK